jgi:hypothetical protein
VDDPRESTERCVLGETLVDELLERAAAALVFVRVLRARCVEAGCPGTPLDRSDLRGLQEEDLGFWIEEAPDQPGRGRPVHVDMLSRQPLHILTISVAIEYVNRYPAYGGENAPTISGVPE